MAVTISSPVPTSSAHPAASTSPARPTSGRAPAALGLPELTALTRMIASRPQLWRPQVRYTATERWWTRLDGPAGVDVWLLSWLQSQGTELHDHGDAAAAFTIAAGTLTEVRPDDRGRLIPRLLTDGETQTVDPGDIHDVVNHDAEPAVSIHAYSPRLTRMTYYTITGGILRPTRTVETDEPEAGR